MKITVIGAGYVGLVTAVCFADLQHDLIVLEKDPKKVKSLNEGHLTIYEPGLEEMLRKALENGKIKFTTNSEEAIKFGDIIFICVGTPQNPDGSADLSQVEEVAREIAKYIDRYKLIVEKSTVPVNTHQWIKKTLKRYMRKHIEYDIASNPEFLREGSAIKDFMEPDRIVIGVETERAKKLLLELYKDFKAPILVTGPAEAELIKHASNSFLATKISYINTIADICDKVGADVNVVAEGMGLDKRIGKEFLRAGIGYGGSCLHPSEIVFVKTVNEKLRPIPIKELFEDFKAYKNFRALSISLYSKDLGKLEELPIIMVTERKYNGKMVRIVTKEGREIHLTEDHPVPVAILEETLHLKLKNASDIIPGDLLIIPTNDFNVKKKKALNLLEEMKDASNRFLDFEIFLPNISENKKIISQILEKKQVEDISYEMDLLDKNILKYRTLLILAREVPELFSFSRLDKAFIKVGDVYIPHKINLTKSFIRLMGIFIGYGEVVDENVIGFEIEESQEYLLEEVSDILIKKRWGHIQKEMTETISVKRIKLKTLQVFSPILYFFSLLYSTNILEDVYKSIPEFVYTLPKALRLEFLKGLAGLPKYQTLRNFHMETTDQKFAESLILLLQISGAEIQKMTRKKVGEIYFYKVTGKFEDEKSPEKLKLTPVKRVEMYHYEGPVYSLETNNSFFITSSGILLHNCFPKDVRAFIKIAEDVGVDFGILREVDKVNTERPYKFVERVKKVLWTLKGKEIAVWGLSFKPNTDDIREAPSIKVVGKLLEEGAKIKAYDPKAIPNFKKIFEPSENIKYVEDMYSALENAHALIILTEWDEFKNADINKIKSLMVTPIIFDARNIFDPEKMEEEGIEYYCIGRGRKKW